MEPEKDAESSSSGSDSSGSSSSFESEDETKLLREKLAKLKKALQAKQGSAGLEKKKALLKQEADRVLELKRKRELKQQQKEERKVEKSR